MRVSISHIDTCFPEYLNDHHNRPSEILVGIPVDGTATNAAVKEALKAEVEQVDAEQVAAATGFYDEVSKAIDDYFAARSDEAQFDSSLDEEYTDETPQAWFLIELETPTKTETPAKAAETPVVDYSRLPAPNRVSINPIEKSVYMAWDCDFSILLSSRGSICSGAFGTPPAFDSKAVEKLIEFLTKTETATNL